MGVSTYRIVAISVLATLVGSLVAGAIVLMLRGTDNAPIQILAPSLDMAGGSSPSAEALRSGATAPITQLLVYISGAVRNPGVYTMQSGARLIDGLTAAGGASEDADLSRINLARRLRDEGHYHIPKVGEAQPSPGSLSGADGRAAGTSPDAGMQQGLIDLNTAATEQLVTLPGIGAVRARAIVAHREKHGPFRTVGEIMDVPGIGPAIFANLRHLVTVDTPP